MKLLELLTIQRKGKFVTEAEEKLRQVVKVCMDTGKSGTFTMRFKITPTGQETLVVSDDLDSKPPKAETMGSTYFPNDQGELFRDDPTQSEFAVVTAAVQGQ